jgi:predicted Rossmann fold flavoprotein
LIVVIGGGPAGFFAAITAKNASPAQDFVILEKGTELLRKVKISGGGRCNVTHDEVDPRRLAASYPRGGRELMGPLSRWSPADTRAWFALRGVRLKTEPDGRVFPVTDSSATIVDCLTAAAAELGITVRTCVTVTGLEKTPRGLAVLLADGSRLDADRVLLATGAAGYRLASGLGHTIVDPVPSLFTFKCDDDLLADLAGVAAAEATLRAVGPGLPRKGLEQTGPLLITHWGLSGPAVLRLSAWGARLIHDCNYCFDLKVDWCPDLGLSELTELLNVWSKQHGRKQVAGSCPVDLPRRLWAALAARAGIPADRVWAEPGRKMLTRLGETLKSTVLAVDGKSTFKEEFVTCGGVKLGEVDFKTMESRVCPGLFLAGEVLDIDGITGGFNFQNCWTSGWLAGQAMARG